MRTGTSFQYFTQVLGEPKYTIPYGLDNSPSSNIKESIFGNSLFYLVALIDTNNNVIQYSITTVSPSFEPKLGGIILGKSTFNKISPKDGLLYVDSCVGAQDYYYYESYYAGRPSEYETTVYGYSEVGGGKIDIKVINTISNQICSYNLNASRIYPTWTLHPTQTQLEQELNLFDTTSNYVSNVMKEPIIQKYRSSTVINTYIVTAPEQDFLPTLSGSIGISYNDIEFLR